jgi:predicted permease
LTDLLGLFGDNILPILLAASAGFALQKLLRLNPRPISQVTFYLFSPALVFNLLLSSEIRGDQVLAMMGLAVVVVLLTAGVSLVASRAMQLTTGMAAAFLLSSTFMNAGNYGLSLNQFVFGSSGLAWATLYFVASLMLTNSLGVFVAARGTRSFKAALIGLLKVPAMYAIPLALLVRELGLVLPLPVSRPIDLLANAAVPVMLVILGMQIGSSGMPTQRSLVAGCVALKLLVAPLIAWAAAPVLGLDGLARQVGIVESAMPTAVMSTIIAIEFDVEPSFVTGTVFISTLLSPLTITPLISILQS